MSTTTKRQKQSTPEPEEQAQHDEALEEQSQDEPQDDGLGGSKWECICVTLEDYQEYMNDIRKSRDPNEKILYKRLAEEVIPVMESLAEEQARKQARKQKELENMQKLAMAKRSSRISSRLEKQKEMEEADAAERKRQAELAQAKAEQERQKKLEEVSKSWACLKYQTNPTQAHDSRRMTREQRLREREAAKVLKEEELRKLQENEQKLANNDARLSERHLKAMMKQHERDLKKLNEEEDWFFDCEKCGTYGSNLASHHAPFTLIIANLNRTTRRLKYRAKSATYGNTSSVMASQRAKSRTPTSSLFARRASAKKQQPTNQNLHP